MTTPIQFEEQYQAEWTELEAALRDLNRRRGARQPVSGERVASLYRQTCEHLAIARARSYPAFLLDRLERLTSDAHQVIYHRREVGLTRLIRLATWDFPRSVRAHAMYVWISAAVLLVPTFVVGRLVYARPELILSIVSADTASSFDEMYSPHARALGSARTSDDDWMMFGYYIRNNIGVAFQCFASGILAGVGSLFFLAVNGALGGGVAGYLTARGLASTFYSFIATHSAFELTAIVLSGAAGLRIGHSLIAPGRLRRVQSLALAGRETAVLIAGVAGMLVVAAAIEAFWSSAQWLPPEAKYASAAVCWAAVIFYLVRQGRDAR